MTIRVSLKTILLLMIAVTLAVPTLALEPRKSAAKPSKARRETATEEYADDVTALSPQTRELQRSASGRFSYCLRSTAAYDCLAYGQDGVVRHRRLEVTAHGTGFAYKKVGNDSYLLTNDHVVSWPAVTTDDNAVTDVPAGCKRTESTVRIVANESDSNERDDTALSLVVTDPLLDVAVLRSKVPLQIMPYRIGRSADLRVGNAVTIQGYPLGIMEAVNTGKVINTADHDTSNDRDHLDFVVDAPLSSGNSGSPVLAISKTSGQLELVGIFHAAYTRGQALNVVVAIDQVLDLMTWFRKTPRPEAVFDRLGALERREFAQWLTQNGGQMFFNLSSLIACAHLSPNGNLVFELFDRSWPLTEDRMLIVVDSQTPPPSAPSPACIWGARAFCVWPIPARPTRRFARSCNGLLSEFALPQCGPCVGEAQPGPADRNATNARSTAGVARTSLKMPRLARRRRTLQERPVDDGMKRGCPVRRWPPGRST